MPGSAHIKALIARSFGEIGLASWTNINTCPRSMAASSPVLLFCPSRCVHEEEHVFFMAAKDA